MADPWFYESPASQEAADSYALSRREAPHLWVKATRGDWLILSPEDHELPSQGWKVHVSGRLDNAERVIDTVWTYCVRRDIPFKFLPSSRVVLARNAKYAGRGGSGKLITIYPRDEAELALVCDDLAAALAGEAGPYILSDLRIGAGPVHVRYGGFAPRHCLDELGEQVLAIEDADGTLVPDRRGPVFALPPWVTLPAFLEPHLAARNATTLADLPFTIERALHFSNGGGVYLGTDQATGEKVVLKEARPHAGLSGDGTDAVTRLRRERDALQRLHGLAGVPRLIDHRTVGEHEFLVMEHVEGESLNTELSRRCPVLGAAAGDDDLAAYATWARGVHGAIAQAIAAIHDRGIVYGDLHMFNVLVRPDGRICLIDFEVATDVAAGQRPTLGAVGYVAPRDRTGFEIDLYALACLQLALFLPLERLIGLDRRKAAHLADVVAEMFPVPRTWLDQAVEVILGAAPTASTVPGPWRLSPDDGGWPLARTAIAEAILASASPDRQDRLFPGDIRQFRTGGLNLAHGAAGVLYALDATGAGRHPRLEEWLIERLHDPVPAPGSGSDPEARLGLYDGAHGVAHVLAQLGHTEEAVKVLDAALDRPWRTGGPDLHSGLAGIGCNLLHLGDVLGDPALHDAAFETAALLADRITSVAATDPGSTGDALPGFPFAGLMRGTTGPALLFVRMYEHTGDPALLDLATTALRLDLRRCVTRGDGQMHVDEGSRTLPYLALGSGGIALVARRILAHRADDELAAAVGAIRLAAQALFYVQPGLFNGRAGMLMVLADGRDPGDPGGPGAPGPEVADQVRRLGWHALSYREQLAFPGDQLLRLSMDLATGSAGVLLALGAALHDRPVHLPFLGPPAPGTGADGAPGSPTDD